MMKVVGEEGTSMDDFIVYLKAEFLDSVYLQQNGFDEIDAATSLERQKYVFGKISRALEQEFDFDHKERARKAFYELRQLFIDWNYKEFKSLEFKKQEKVISDYLDSYKQTEAQASA